MPYRVTYPLGTQGAPEHPPHLFSLALAPLRGLSFKPQLCSLSQDRPPGWIPQADPCPM